MSAGVEDLRLNELFGAGVPRDPCAKLADKDLAVYQDGAEGPDGQPTHA